MVLLLYIQLPPWPILFNLGQHQILFLSPCRYIGSLFCSANVLQSLQNVFCFARVCWSFHVHTCREWGWGDDGFNMFCFWYVCVVFWYVLCFDCVLSFARVCWSVHTCRERWWGCVAKSLMIDARADFTHGLSWSWWWWSSWQCWWQWRLRWCWWQWW